MNDRDYALVVGIDRLADDSQQPLEGARRDAGEFAEWLMSPVGGSLPEDHVKPFMFISDEPPTVPEWNDLVKGIKDLLAFSRGGEERIGRRLYIFLAGHGVAPDMDDAALLAVDSTDESPMHFSGRQYANLFAVRALFEEVVLCMDCCRDYDPELPALFPFKLRPDAGAAHGVKRFYAFATGFGRKSRERDIDGTTRGIFTRHLLNGLKGDARDGDGRVTGLSLKRYLKRKLKDEKQRPTFDIDDEMVLAAGLGPRTAPVTVSLRSPERGFVVLDGNGLSPVDIAPVEVGDGSYRVDLPVYRTYLFQVLGDEGQVLRQDGRAVDEASGVIHVNL